MVQQFIPIIIIAVVIIGLISFFVSRYVVPEAGEAIVVSGSKVKQGNQAAHNKVLTQRGAFIVPVIQRAVKISLKSRQVTVDCDAYSQDKITLHLQVVATYKVGSTEAQICEASERFAEVKPDVVNGQIQNIIEGAMREIVGEMTVVDLIGDRQKFRDSLMNVINDSLSKMGLDLDNLSIKEISDSNGYIRNLGRPQEAEVARLADVAEAENSRQSAEAKIAAQLAVEQKNKDFKIQKAQIDEEVAKQQAIADSAKTIADAQQQQLVQKEQQKVEMANVEVTKAKLAGEVNAKADADKYRKTIEAQADAAAVAEAAKGEAEARRIKAEADAAAKKVQAAADAEVTRQTQQAQADGYLANETAKAQATKLNGQAEADSIQATGSAEADAMHRKATAYELYGQAALASEIIKILPAIAESLAKPLATAKFTAINADASDQITSITSDLTAKLPETVNALTGIDLVRTLKDFARNNASNVNTDTTATNTISGNAGNANTVSTISGGNANTAVSAKNVDATVDTKKADTAA